MSISRTLVVYVLIVALCLLVSCECPPGTQQGKPCIQFNLIIFDVVKTKVATQNKRACQFLICLWAHAGFRVGRFSLREAAPEATPVMSIAFCMVICLH